MNVKIKEFVNNVKKDMTLLKKYKNLEDLAKHFNLELDLLELAESAKLLGDIKGCSVEGTKVFYDI